MDRGVFRGALVLPPLKVKEKMTKREKLIIRGCEFAVNISGLGTPAPVSYCQIEYVRDCSHAQLKVDVFEYQM